jgi:hypothetical protein
MPTLACGDVDTDGAPELVFASGAGTKLNVLKADGRQPQGWPAAIACGETLIFCAIADLDDDDRPEVIAAGGSKVFAFTADGKPLPGFPASLGSASVGIAAADVNADGKAEIVAATASGVFAFDRAGKAAPGWPLVEEGSAGRQICTQPLPCDVDCDGDIEIVAGAADFLFIWDLPSGHDPGRIQWPVALSSPCRHDEWEKKPAAPAKPSASGSADRTVTWAQVDGAAGYHVYRALGNGNPSRITAALVREATFTDKTDCEGANLGYAVTSVTKRGVESRLSEKASWTDPRPAAMAAKAAQSTEGGDTASAAETLRALIKIYPESPCASEARVKIAEIAPAGTGGLRSPAGRLIALGEAWLKAGLKKKAAACFIEALRAAPSGPTADAARAKLAGIRD